MAAIKSKYKRFNGVAWEEYYFETSVDQVIGLVDFIKNNETKLSTNDSTATSGKYISRIQVSDHGLTITKEDLPNGISGDYNDLINKPKTVVATSEMTEKVGLNANNELVVKPSSRGFLPDEGTITLNDDDELEATNVAIWRYV